MSTISFPRVLLMMRTSVLSCYSRRNGISVTSDLSSSLWELPFPAIWRPGPFPFPKQLSSTASLINLTKTTHIHQTCLCYQGHNCGDRTKGYQLHPRSRLGPNALPIAHSLEVLCTSRLEADLISHTRSVALRLSWTVIAQTTGVRLYGSYAI